MPQKGADSGPPRIAPDRPDRSGRRLGVDPHGAKLEHHERAPIEAHSFLSVEQWTPVFKPDTQGDNGQEWQQDDHRRRRNADVHAALHKTAPALEWNL